MTLSSIQSAYSQAQLGQTANPPAQSQKSAAPGQLPQDTVTLSSTAKQAQPSANVGDVDHDGDSH
jgi:hypothetical protein